MKRTSRFTMIKKHIPNTLTCCNLLSGCLATYQAMSCDMERALIFIIIGAAFDFFDGLSARLLNVSSPIGKELDSLADNITFGFAPATMVCNELCNVNAPGLPEFAISYVPFIGLLIAAFSALRLAKFNLDTRQATSFIGLPTPANALFWAALITAHGKAIECLDWAMPAIIALILLSCWLLVAEIPMFALKFKHWGIKGNEVRYFFLAVSAALLLLIGVIESLPVIVVLYILLSITLWLWPGKSTGKTA